jgi:hypothetical protein
MLDMEGTFVFNEEVFLDDYDSTIFSVVAGESFDCII